VSDAADPSGSIDLSARLRSYELVRAVLANADSRERRIAAARDVVAAVLAESGVDGLADVAVELSLKLAAAFERIAGDQGLAAVDLAEVWLVD
jgi:hypothetical protein